MALGFVNRRVEPHREPVQAGCGADPLELVHLRKTPSYRMVRRC
jgi:hypothetical protein